MTTKIAFILSQEEFFSKNKAGALAVWVNELLPLLPSKNAFLICRKSKTTLNPEIKKHQINVDTIMKMVSFFSFLKGVSFHIKNNLYPIIAGVICRIKSVDIIHVHNRPTYAIVIKKIYPKSKIILHFHNDHVFSLNRTQIRELDGSCDLIISVSEYIQNGVLKKANASGLNLKEKCVVLFNGCNPDLFKKHVPATNNTILFVGRLKPEKGIKELVEAVVIANKYIPDIKLLIIGGDGFGKTPDSDFIKEIKLSIPENSKKNIQFLGYMEHDLISKEFSNAAVYCIPSVWQEPFGLTVVEGMASGIPMIVGDVGGIPDIVNDTALKVDCKDINRLADTIIYALENKNEMKLLADKAYDRFTNNFTWKHIANSYIEIIDKL